MILIRLCTMDVDDNKLAHSTMILRFLELKAPEKLEVGFLLSSVVELDTLHKGVITYA